MSKAQLTLRALVLVVVSLMITSVAQAQATRTWVSGVGDDLNPCSRTAPCKTFAGAISKTANGGEINVLDNGSFGSVTITKSITIDGNEQHAAILASSTNGVTVNATATDRVILRNLSISGMGGTVSPFINGLNGIRFLAGDKLVVENCRIMRFTNSLILVDKTSSGDVTINNVTGSVSLGTVANVDAGIRMTTTSGVIKASINNVNLQDCKIGINLQDRVEATIRNTTINGNGDAADIGVRVATTVGGVNTRANLEGVTISNVAEGLRTTTAGANLTVQSFISNCNFFKCSIAAVNTGANARVTTSVNNKFSDNTADISGPSIQKLDQ